jgi:hypothetical protein
MSEMCAQLTRERALEILVGIAQDTQNEPKDRVHALQVYAEISGGDAPMKLELGVDGFAKWYLTELRGQPIGDYGRPVLPLGNREKSQ